GQDARCASTRSCSRGSSTPSMYSEWRARNSWQVMDTPSPTARAAIRSKTSRIVYWPSAGEVPRRMRRMNQPSIFRPSPPQRNRGSAGSTISAPPRCPGNQEGAAPQAAKEYTARPGAQSPPTSRSRNENPAPRWRGAPPSWGSLEDRPFAARLIQQRRDQLREVVPCTVQTALHRAQVHPRDLRDLLVRLPLHLAQHEDDTM